VVWDLDNEARDKAAELGIAFARAATAGPDPRFAELIVELIREHTEDLPLRKLSTLPAAGRSINGEPLPY
jgi:ferrochelatase